VGSSRKKIHGSLRGPGRSHLLALAGREGADPLRLLLVEPDRLDQLVDRAPAVLRGQPVELAEHPELLADGQDPVARLLAARDHVHDPADLLGLVLNVEAEDLRGPLRRQQQRREDLDQRRLAGAVRPEQPEELARLDLKIDALEGDHGRLRGVHAADAADVDGEGLGFGGHGHPEKLPWRDAEYTARPRQ
jgi:hypothetical protein